MEKMLDLFQEPIEIQDLPEAKPLVMTGGEVVFGKISLNGAAWHINVDVIMRHNN
jgi:hypothetical protein